MATITTSTPNTPYAETVLNRVVLEASNTFIYSKNSGQKLFMYNSGEADVQITITGDGASTVTPRGLGVDVDLEDGFILDLEVGYDATIIPLDSVKDYLKGTITLAQSDSSSNAGRALIFI
jgi:hypothetical protein